MARVARAAAVSAGSDGARAGRRTASGEQARLPGGAGDRRAREAGGWLFAALTSERWSGGAASVSASASGGRRVIGRGAGRRGGVSEVSGRCVGKNKGPARLPTLAFGEYVSVGSARRRSSAFARRRSDASVRRGPPHSPAGSPPCSFAGGPLREPDCRPFAGVPVRPPPAPRRLPAAYQWHSMARSMKRTSIRPSGCSSTAARSNCTSPCHPSRAR